MKNRLRAFLILMCLSHTEIGQAQYFDFISTITDNVPKTVWIGGKADAFGGGLRRAIRFNTWEPTHYGLRYDITSMRVKCATTWSDGAEFRIGSGKWIQVWIHENADGDLPGRRVIKFSSRSTRQSDIQDGLAIRSHGRSGGSPSNHLKANTHYWFVLDTNYSRNFSDGAKIKVAGADGYGSSPRPSRWSVTRGLEAQAWDIQGIRNDSPDVGFWSYQSSDRLPLQFRVRGQRAIPDPLEMGEVIQVGNLDQSNFSDVANYQEARKETITAQRWVATRFITLSSPELPPHLFSVNHITMLNPIRSSVPSNTHFIRIFSSTLTASGWAHPNNVIGRFSTGNPQVIRGEFPGSHSSDNNQQHRFHVDEGSPIYLKPNTHYWIVQGMVHTFQGSSPKLISFTRSNNQEGWPVSDEMLVTTNRGQQWQTRTYSDKILKRTMRFELDVKIIPAKGDLNRDAKINILDLVKMNNEIRGWASLPGNTVHLANMNDSRDLGIDGSDRNLLIDIIMGR